MSTDPLSITRLAQGEANVFLERWGHPLGGCNRPFEQNFWGMVVRSKVVAVVVTASPVSPTVRDDNERTWERKQVVELARIGSAPGKNWATRPLLRLWREVLVHEWASWTPKLLISYALPGTAGNIYRFDGWTKIREVNKAAPGKSSQWAKGSATDTIGTGKKTLWAWHMPVTDPTGTP